ncbi:hypothetical protein BDV96DRAFT_492110 [Lophiotrema nucula]|uniref:Cyclin-like protein n=1 Tax=Lophiotrema nucula TaxID=690887 RepID=A0A6A5ZBQ0_9PLEO|nr:hypothetical protein BDV96DRAFT_492110 [Lophiotrema nucula]
MSVATARGAPPGRLLSINNSAPGRGPRRNAFQPTPPPAAPPQARARPTCCETPEVGFDAQDRRVCISCGELLSNESEIVAEITFGETAAGAAIVQGGFVGDGQRHANTLGGTVTGISETQVRQQAEQNGRDAIRKLCGILHQPDIVTERAHRIYTLALGLGFIRGRTINLVAAASIYYVCRQNPRNDVLLIDLAEKIEDNVWKLGDVHKALIKELVLHQQTPDRAHSQQEIEPLMLKYCRKLEFGEYSYRIAEDACKVLNRMQRDWMIQGRQPAGLCGACIILAARMNNFRRTVREVVYVVKVADTTINQRLHEFRRTRASDLTVKQFHEIGHRLKVTAVPPAIYKRTEREERKRKGAEEDSGVPNEEELQAAEAPRLVQPPSDRAAKKPTRTVKKRKTANGQAQSTAVDNGSAVDAANAGSPAGPRRDTDGFAIPDVPTRPSFEDVDTGEDLDQLAENVEPRDEDFELEIEADLENEINATIHDYEKTFKSFDHDPNHPLLQSVTARSQALMREHMTNNIPDHNIAITEDEFQDDPDVMDCLLSDDEIAQKERVWITENADWLREQQKKVLAKALEEASGKEPKPKQKRKISLLGDGSVLEGERPTSTRASVEKMQAKRNSKQTKFSRAINYEMLNSAYAEEDGLPSEGSTPGDGTPSAVGTPARPQTQVEAAEELGVEYEGEVQVEEEGYNTYLHQYDEEGNYIEPVQEEEEEEYNYDDY